MNRDESAMRRQQVDEARGDLELTRHMAETAARAATGMFARDVTIIDLREIVSYTDYFVVASAETERQTRRIVEEVLEKMREEGYRPARGASTRGRPGSAWTSSMWSSTSSPTKPATTTAWNPSGAAPPRNAGRSSAELRRATHAHFVTR